MLNLPLRAVCFAAVLQTSSTPRPLTLAYVALTIKDVCILIFSFVIP